LIIDGLDEITTRTGGGAVDEVLEKLSSLGRPNFVLSCRAADWQGSTARHKIESDYGTAPTILHLLPFSYDNAKQFLAEYIEEIRAEEVLDELSKRNLDGFYGNPLTLRLIAELVVGRQRLPETRAGLFDQACRLLVREENPWDASEFILSCINGIGAESSEVATDLLGYLIAKPSTASYAEHLKHASPRSESMGPQCRRIAPALSNKLLILR